MKLPKQTRPVERRTVSAVASGAQASAALSPLIKRALFPMLSI